MNEVNNRPHTAGPELLALAKQARQHACDLAAGRKKWTMSIPVQTDDSDRLFCNAIDDLVAEVKRLIMLQATP